MEIWRYAGSLGFSSVLFGLLYLEIIGKFCVITGDVTKVYSLGLSVVSLQFANQPHVVCHHFYCFLWVANSFPLFIFWIFCTARGKRTFPKAQHYVTVKLQDNSGQGICSLEWPDSYGEDRPLPAESHVAVATLSSSFQKTVWEKCPLYWDCCACFPSQCWLQIPSQHMLCSWDTWQGFPICKS